MEAKDTIIPVEERIKMGVWHGRERQAQAQAEISFKAGIREVASWLQQNCKYEIEAGKDSRELATFVIEKWQAKLKEWEGK